MYFIHDKNRWVRSVATINPVIRYAGLVIAIIAALLVWRYGLYLWLDSMIQQEQAAVNQLQH